MHHEKAVAIAESSASAAANANIAGAWKNELGSVMEIAVSGNIVSGTYTSAQSGGGGPVSGPLQGYVAGDLVSFQVLWPGGSITAWVGHVFGGGGGTIASLIETLWYLVSEIPNPDDPDDFWQAVLAGADSFIPADEALTRNPRRRRPR